MGALQSFICFNIDLDLSDVCRLLEEAALIAASKTPFCVVESLRTPGSAVTHVGVLPRTVCTQIGPVTLLRAATNIVGPLSHYPFFRDKPSTDI